MGDTTTTDDRAVNDPSLISCPKSLKMVAAAFYLPKDNTMKPQGDDSHFICEEKQTFGLADGVGGWARKGVDAGEYARELMINSNIAMRNETKGEVDPKRVLNEAYVNTNANGSSTACIVTLTDNDLHVANVGDSGFMLFRDNKCIYRSPLQQKSYNRPYQLGKNSDRPSSAMEFKVPVISGDIIVAGTDGLFDNMYLREIEDMLVRGAGLVGAEQLAWTIAEAASLNSQNKYADTPFALHSRLAGKEMSGGKVDDITVIVGQIVADTES